MVKEEILKLKNYRHGDMALIGIEKLPEGLKASKSKVLMVGSGGNDHVITRGTFYPKQKNDFIVGYLRAKETELLHKDHGEGDKKESVLRAKINDGYYQVRKQQEDTHGGMKPVVD